MPIGPEATRLIKEIAGFWPPASLPGLAQFLFDDPDMCVTYLRARLRALQERLTPEEYRRIRTLLIEHADGISEEERQALLVAQRHHAEEDRRRDAAARLKREDDQRREQQRQHQLAVAQAAVSDRLERNFLAADARFLRGLVADEDVAALEALRVGFVQRWCGQRGLRAESDPEQATAIASVHEHTLVTARAGSGKTDTLTTRARFLVEHCDVSAEELLLLVFNRSAKAEMRRRLARMGCDLPHVLTFHALAYAVVHPEQKLVYDDADAEVPLQSQVVQRVITELLDEDVPAAEVRAIMLGHFRGDWETLAQGGLVLPADEGLAFRRSLASETLRGELVKSRGERLIANFLFEHDLPYQYERSHWWGNRNYRPDFTLPLGDRGVVIEYFGLTGDAEYNAEAAEKRAYWATKEGYAFVELSRHDLDGGDPAFEERLRRRLTELGVVCERLPEDEIWRRIRDRAQTAFARMVRTFVGRCRKAGVSPARLTDLVGHHRPVCDAEARFLGLARRIYDDYLERLNAEDEEDFDGLLERAAKMVEDGQTAFEHKLGAGDLSRVRFVLVDEFQDFSLLYCRMLHAAREHSPGVQLFCVGDDWQAINAFAGATTRYFDGFEAEFRPAVRLPVATNYRSAPRIVEVGNRVMSGRGTPARASKEQRDAGPGAVLFASLAGFEATVAERERYKGVTVTPAVGRIIRAALKNGESVALLGRTNRLPYHLGRGSDDNDLDACRRAWTVGLDHEERERVVVTTVHQFKGRQADTVVLLDATPRRFPLVHSDLVFTRVLGDTVERVIDDERRLFYVACTRAKATLVLLTDRELSPFCATLTPPVTQALDWERYPSLERASDRWTVRVTSRYGTGAGPTSQTRRDLQAHGFSFYGRSRSWARTFPLGDADLQALCATLERQSWAMDGHDVEVRVEHGDRLVGSFLIDNGTWKPTGAVSLP